MYISRKFTTRSLPEIAKEFDKSHATIIHGVKNITNRLDVDPELKQNLEEILDELGCSAGDMVDGNYPTRPENPRQQFLHGFDEQARYVCDMYPKVDGITTYYILGSHDETHYKNGQATLSEWIPRVRKDMVYLGQDTGVFDLDGVKIVLDHPGGGSAKSLSYKPQQRIEEPKVLLIGHYHKSYSFVYRNVQCVLVPALCDKTQFQQKQGLSNNLGAYFLDIYSDKKGNIQYFMPEEIIFTKEDIWDEVGKDKKKVQQLVIEKKQRRYTRKKAA